MLSYQSLFALLVVIGMTTALPMGGDGSELLDVSEIIALLLEMHAALAELRNSVPGALTVPSLPGVSVPRIPDVTLPTLPPLPFTFPPLPAVPSA